MKAPMQIESLIQYTSVAATTIEDVAGSFHIPFLASAATLSLSILKCVEVSLVAAAGRNIWLMEARPVR
jgi:hypothetical protein